MKTNTRFIKSIVATADTSNTPLPWARGARRAAFIVKRDEKTPQLKSA